MTVVAAPMQNGMFRENFLIAEVNEYQKNTPHKASMYD